MPVIYRQLNERKLNRNLGLLIPIIILINENLSQLKKFVIYFNNLD
jgi:hypothetical protein